MGGVTAAWLTFMAIQTVKYEKNQGPGLPPPTLYIGSGVVYGLLGLVAIPQPRFAAIMGWGWIVGALVTNSFGTGTTQTVGGSSSNRAVKAPKAPKPPRQSAARSGPPVAGNVPAPIVAPN